MPVTISWGIVSHILAIDTTEFLSDSTLLITVTGVPCLIFGIPVTSIVVMFIQTLPTIGATYPSIDTTPLLERRRSSPNPYPIGIVAIRIKDDGIYVPLYPILDPGDTSFIPVTREIMLNTG